MDITINNFVGRWLVGSTTVRCCQLIVVAGMLMLLAACGGGSSGGGDSFSGGGFANRPEIKVNISASRMSLPPANTFVPFPNPSSDPYTTILTVTVTQDDRPFTLGDGGMSLAITGGLNHGSLVCPEIEGAEGPCTDFDENAAGDEVPVGQFRYRAIASGAEGSPPVGLNAGVFQFFFIAEGDPNGTAVITASVTDPNTGQNVADSIQIRVTEGVSTGDPAQIFFDPATPTPLYIQGQGLTESLAFRIQVFDDALEPVPNPGGRNNLQLQILPNSPNGGEVLSTIDANGQTQTGRTVTTRTLNGLAQATITSGSLPGTVRITATADRFDNNVDNGIQEAVTDVYTISIGQGQPRSLAFTGPFVNIVNDNENVLATSTAEQLVGGTITDAEGNTIAIFADNIYTIPITVLAIDEFGNPPPQNTQITFRVVDSPLVGYPDAGRGEFAIGGDDGNIQEGGNLFTTPPGGSTFTGSQPGCQLVYEGNPPDQEGGRIITSVNSSRQLAVNTPFNEAPDSGFTVPYVVGCPPHAGSVGQIGSGRTVAFTNTEGVATVDLIYDATQLGRRFKLVAEASGGEAGAVLSYWYLGVGTASLELYTENGEFLTSSSRTVEVDVGSADSETYIVRLTDGNDLPLPAQLLSISAELVDPDADLAAQRLLELQDAELRVQLAQDAFDQFIEESGDVCGVVDGPAPSADPTDPADVPPTCPNPRPTQVSCGDIPDPMNPGSTLFTNVVLSNSALGQTCPLPLVDGLTCSQQDLEACVTASATAVTLEATLATAEANLFTAQQNLAEAEALDAQYDPVVTVNGEAVDEDIFFEVLTGGNGETPPLTFAVNDLPPQRTGGALPSVTFLITTVGPDPQAPTLPVIFQVPAAATGGTGN